MSVPAVQVVAPPPPAATSTGRLIASLGLVAAICGLIIVGAFEGSLPAVRENRRIAIERAVNKVLPGAKQVVGWRLLPGGTLAPADAGDAPAGAIAFHAAYDAGGRLIGIAAEGAAKGYADAVRIMFGYTPGCQCVVGVAVVGMRETPGIGDKIITDRQFLANFQALDVRLDAELKALAHAVVTVKHGSKTQPWQVDAIAGATITSRAVGKAINDTAQALLPKLLPQFAKIGNLP